MPQNDKPVLVVCIDRDDDLGQKTRVKGPAVGKKRCLDAALALARADPSDTDSNTMFDAIKTAEEIKNAEIAVLTGDEKVGVESDTRISAQLDALLSKKKYDGVILVTDGADDEQLLPIIQSRARIISVKRVVVKQAEQLESAYYTVIDFSKRVMKDAELARFFIGVPGLAILLIALFGSQGWRVVEGMIGGYLIIKGLQLESHLGSLLLDIYASFRKRKFSFFTYVLSIVLVLLSLFQGLNEATGSQNMIIAISSFIHGAAFPLLVAGISVVIGKSIDSFPNYDEIIHHINSGILLGVSLWTLRAISSYFLEPSLGLINFISAAMVGLIIVVVMEIIKKFSVSSA